MLVFGVILVVVDFLFGLRVLRSLLTRLEPSLTWGVCRIRLCKRLWRGKVRSSGISIIPWRRIVHLGVFENRIINPILELQADFCAIKYCMLKIGDEDSAGTPCG
jgi:hypothetical protein